ncbi:DUF4153 domain-containing protein [Pseudoalteromonas sp. A22]|uniref:DUF4153 domain-containing protein n=1 Tax=Pseudoalteromonas TaxID=53246 RepID=UPI001BA930B4|nr:MULTISPECIES: DUF4153 domain-containing protein [Pseudoalteromonas]QUI61439.1 DUF4153 domain-containing protein [Pseudoalteromonas sp. A22]USE71079.1 hypothetical protein CTT31_18425 [Pseudoalteromonas flavipulchra]
MDITQQSKRLLLLALVQGVVLVLLHQLLAIEHWPKLANEWLFGLYAFAITFPALILYASFQSLTKKQVLWFIAFGVLVLSLGFYTGLQLHSPLSDTFFQCWPFPLVLFLCTFLVIPLVVTDRSHASLPQYSALADCFASVITVFLTAQLFTLATGAILGLWAGLFSVINIKFFAELFSEPWFFYPALTLAQAIGVINARDKASTLSQLFIVCQGFARLLLPVLAFISSLFLISLLGTGLAPLWQNGGSALVFFLLGAQLITLNTANYGKNSSTWVQILTLVVLICFPIYISISAYGLWLRVDQYGFNIARLWAITICAFLGLFAIGYLVNFARFKSSWVNNLGLANRPIVLLITSILLMSQSPLLDFRKITVMSQVSRFLQSNQQIDQLDTYYFANQLGKPGVEALEEIKRNSSDAVLIKTIERALTAESAQPEDVDIWTNIELLNVASDALPIEMKHAVSAHVKQSPYAFQYAVRTALFAIQLDKTEETEYLLLIEESHDTEIRLIYLDDGKWQIAYFPLSKWAESDNKIIELLLQGQYRRISPRFDRLQIGEKTYKPEH